MVEDKRSVSAIRVLVVEDSITQRHQLVSLIQKAPDMAVIGQARDGLEAVHLVETLRPDVISMDIRMPHLGGLDATRQIMEQFPTPIVIVSNASSDADMAMQAMQAGALAAIEKPPAKSHPEFEARCDELLSMLRLMAGVRVIRHWGASSNGTGDLPTTPPAKLHDRLPEIVAVGASAGGPGTLATLFRGLPSDFCLPILVVQHLAVEFMPGLADWLSRSGSLPVRLAVDGEMPAPGVALVAPGGHHMRLGADRRIVLDSNRGNFRHHPAVDVLLGSVADCYGARAIGAVLTGMGDDGAVGLRAMRDAGARTIAQDEATSVVFGMPAASIALGAAEFVLPLEKIASTILLLSDRGEGRPNANSAAR
jgi:two-component system, chemotaxis family, protein-glutamate methylesterase/glutaminase